MKQLYVVTVDMGEDSVYFTEMTDSQADQMRRMIRRAGYRGTVMKIKRSPGFNSFHTLMRDFADQAGARARGRRDDAALYE